MVGQTLGHYRIVEKLGAGGMGEVYRAHDERLDRDVALKVLPAGLLADESARQRFRKEALALAKLNHPNIASVHDFDTHNGVDFLAMEYIAGVTLSDKLAAGGLAEKEVVRLGGQLAEGLAAAHEHGVVHRDLKPGNLRVTPDGRLKILDFGLAKLVRPDADPDVTASLAETKAVVGTLPYMAPEQLRGEAADARTDIYASGVVLYEMATGRRPFEQTVTTALAADIQHKTPPPPSRVKPDLSDGLEGIILKCLEKEPENRYHSAKEIAVDLRRLTSTSAVTVPTAVPPARAPRWLWPVGAAGAVVLIALAVIALNLGGLRDRLFARGGAAPIQSLAVLPLANLSGDASQEYFADGMTEALIENLSRIRALRVISRTSVMQFKGTRTPLPEIARKLGVDAVVEGSVLRAENRVRITAQLVRAQPEEHLWANSYDREMRDILALHSEVARAIAGEVRARLTTQEQARLSGARAVKPEVYEAYLQGRALAAGFALGDPQKGITFYQRAIELDKDYAPAYAGLAKTYINSGFLGIVPPNELFGQAREAATKAIALDDSLSEAHAAMGWVSAVADWDWGNAEREFQRALELNPSSAEVHHGYSTFLSAIGRHEQAIAEAKTAQQLDPLSPGMVLNVGWRYFGARKLDLAIAEYRKVLEMSPGNQVVRQSLAEVYLWQGRHKEALAEIERLMPIFEANPGLLPHAAAIYAGAGQKAEARRMLERSSKAPKQLYGSPMRLAIAYAYLGDKDRAFAELEKAFQDHDVWMIFLKWGPLPDEMHSDPRYLDLVRRMNFPPSD